MPGSNILGNCSSCCGGTNNIAVTCESRTSNSATLEGFEPCEGDAPGTCTRWRQYTISYTLQSSGVWGDDCVYDCDTSPDTLYGGVYSFSNTATSVVRTYDGGYVGGTVRDVSEFCSNNVSFTNAASGCGIQPNQDVTCTGTSINTGGCPVYFGPCEDEYSLGDGSCVLNGCFNQFGIEYTSLSGYSATFQNMDTFEAARARAGQTVGTNCCASREAGSGPCNEGAATEVQLNFTGTATPSTTITVRFYFSDGSSLDAEVEVDSGGNFEGVVEIPMPSVGATRCYQSAEVL